jgi:hypothetical protein
MKRADSAGSFRWRRRKTPETRGVFRLLLAMIQQNSASEGGDDARSTVKLQLTVWGQSL